MCRKNWACPLAIAMLVPIWISCVSYSDFYALDWRKLTKPPPTPLEINEMKSDINHSLSKIKTDLMSTSRYTRRSAAYRSELLSSLAQPVTKELFKTYNNEYDSVNKAFLLRALAEASEKSSEIELKLKNNFRQCMDKVLKTYIAGAITTIGKSNHCEIEYQYLLDSLYPIGTTNEMANEMTKNFFWEPRWAAAYMIVKMDKMSSRFIPALEKLAESQDAPSWVKKQVWFTLRKITAAELIKNE